MDSKIKKDIIINTINTMTNEQLEKFIKINNIDFRIWFKISFDGRLANYWVHEDEINEIMERYKDRKIDLEPVSFCELWSN